MKRVTEPKAKLDRLDVFSPEELFLLAGTETLHAVQPSVINRYQKDQEARQVLNAKKMLDEHGQLTKAGFLVARMMHHYADALQYERVNRYTFVKHPDFQDRYIVLAEVRPNQFYQVRVLSNTSFLELLLLEYPVLGRYKAHKDWNFQEVSPQLKEKLLLEKVTDIPDYVELETASVYALALPELAKEPIEKAVFFTIDDKLTYYNLRNQNMYYANPGILNYILLQSLGFQLKEEATLHD